MSRPSGKASLYLLFLVVGAVGGAIGGAEFIRRVYLPAIRAEIAQSPVQSPSQVPEQAQFVTDARHTAIVEATRRVSPCVVGIVVTQIQVVRSQYFGDFFDFFFAPDIAPRYREVENMGSGFLISSDGLILTNYPVVEGAEKLFVTQQNGTELEGKIVGLDPQTDLALIRVARTDCPYVAMGNSDDLMTAEWTIAIGNPFGFFIKDAHPTVTVGVVSATNRNFAPATGGEGVYYQGMIQTDAAINPGNSGGPLVNALGEVIGINTFIYTGGNANRGSIGIGFALPINRAKAIVKELVTYGQRRTVWTGISAQNLTRSIALSLGYDKLDGVVVTSVDPGSPGEVAGIKSGDIITRMGDRTIQSAKDIEGFFLDFFVGDSVPIDFLRDGKTRSVALVLKEIPKRGR